MMKIHFTFSFDLVFIFCGSRFPAEETNKETSSIHHSYISGLRTEAIIAKEAE